jgi:metal-responsive CopG/Arc/MetJ family transcriptional regulator
MYMSDKKHQKNTQRVHLTLPEKTVIEIDIIAEEKFAGNRSMAINYACRELIEDNQNLIEENKEVDE